MRVIHVDVYPPLTEPILRQTAAAIWRYAQGLALEKSRIEPVVMGMDPEFILRMPEIGLVSADRYLDKRGTAGCDAMRYRGQKVVFPLAELRPEPSADIYELFGNLRKAMHMAAKRIDPKLEWIAGGMPHKGFPLGGHLHFSGIWLNNKLLRALDAGLALPLTLIEDDTTRLRRPRYGFLGDARRKRHGGFEYRTLPSWIVTPGITIGVLALAKLIVDHYASLSDFERIDESTDDASLLHFEQLDETTVRAYYEGDKKTLLPIVERKWRVLEELPSYAQYERYLAPLKRRILSCQPWNEHQDFRPAWKIRR